MMSSRHDSNHVQDVSPLSVYAAVRQGYPIGLCLLPTAGDGSKRPAVPTWIEFKTTRPTLEQMKAFQWANQAGLGMIAGPVSGHRESWDFDDLAVYHAFMGAADSCGLGDVVRRL